MERMRERVMETKTDGENERDCYGDKERGREKEGGIEGDREVGR